MNGASGTRRAAQRWNFGIPCRRRCTIGALREERVLLLEASDCVETIVDPKDAAESAGLRYVSDARPGIRRRKIGTGFSYTRTDGSKLTEKDVAKSAKKAAETKEAVSA